MWLAARRARAGQPGVLQGGLDHPSAKLFPIERSPAAARRLRSEDRRSTPSSTPASATHHLQFGYDANDTLWSSGGGPVRRLAEHEDVRRDRRRAKSQGWTAFVLDTNGNGKRDEYIEPGRAGRSDEGQAHRRAVLRHHAEPGRRIDLGRGDAAIPGAVVRIVPGSRIRRRPRWPRSTTCRCPASARAAPTSTATASSGCRWRAAISAASIGASARGRSTDRRRPAITVPRAGRSTSIRARASRASARTAPSRATTRGWISTTRSGSATNVPMSTGNLNDGLHRARERQDGRAARAVSARLLREGLDGRIDDPNAGWKGRGLWVPNGDRTPWLIEGGKGTRPLAVHFQLRPDPLAK